MKSRAKRTVARPATRALVMERDVDALELLGWGGVLATTHFAPLVYPSRRVAQRRLRALLDHVLVRGRTQGDALDRDTLFVLTRAGTTVLAETRGFEDFEPGVFPRPQKLAHVLAIRDAFVAFLAHAKETGFVIDDIELESDAGLTGLREARLVPDLVVRYARDDAPPVLVEVDLGHERRAVLLDKLTRYERYLAAGPARILFLTKTESRARWINARFAEAFPERVISFPLAKLKDGVAACSRALFAPTVRAERTGRRVERVIPLQVLPERMGAFRIVGRAARGVRVGRVGG